MFKKFPSIAIWITSATYAGFAIWLGSSPDALLDAFGIAERTPQMATEIRAFYGGIEMGIAVAMLILWRRRELFASLLIGGLPLAGSSIGRCLGILADGFSNIHAGLAGVEAVGAAFCLVGCYFVSKQTQND